MSWKQIKKSVEKNKILVAVIIIFTVISGFLLGSNVLLSAVDGDEVFLIAESTKVHCLNGSIVFMAHVEYGNVPAIEGLKTTVIVKCNIDKDGDGVVDRETNVPWLEYADNRNLQNCVDFIYDVGLMDGEIILTVQGSLLTEVYGTNLVIYSDLLLTSDPSPVVDVYETEETRTSGFTMEWIWILVPLLSLILIKKKQIKKVD